MKLSLFLGSLVVGLAWAAPKQETNKSASSPGDVLKSLQGLSSSIDSDLASIRSAIAADSGDVVAVVEVRAKAVAKKVTNGVRAVLPLVQDVPPPSELKGSTEAYARIGHLARDVLRKIGSVIFELTQRVDRDVFSTILSGLLSALVDVVVSFLGPPGVPLKFVLQSAVKSSVRVFTDVLYNAVAIFWGFLQ
ncbi:hypothetical protein BHE90_017011 [Fusarium euwallaceae]|uniref:Cell wall protein n=1 Tax=Fusarium euwallaceae TaxID=1147111 RepID=A0A430KYR8_9HYPO|nr:hypothetical protein BHE90_017011 [Fusarium euwallaceae]